VVELDVPVDVLVDEATEVEAEADLEVLEVLDPARRTRVDVEVDGSGEKTLRKCQRRG
jgi:hypothetical protein